MNDISRNIWYRLGQYYSVEDKSFNWNLLNSAEWNNASDMNLPVTVNFNWLHDLLDEFDWVILQSVVNGNLDFYRIGMDWMMYHE